MGAPQLDPGGRRSDAIVSVRASFSSNASPGKGRSKEDLAVRLSTAIARGTDTATIATIKTPVRVTTAWAIARSDHPGCWRSSDALGNGRGNQLHTSRKRIA